MYSHRKKNSEATQNTIKNVSQVRALLSFFKKRKYKSFMMDSVFLEQSFITDFKGKFL